MTRRVFEHEAKFWEIWRDGSSVVTRFGRTGEGGHTTLVDAGSVEEADHLVEARVRARLARGFVEQGEVAPALGPPVAAGDLDAQIASLPPLADDPAYLVFGDWLQAQGDPWGELVALQYNALHAPAKKRASLDKATAAVLDKLADTIVGPAGRHAHSRFVWHHGFVRTAVLGSSPDPAIMLAGLQALLARPASRMIEGIVLNPVPVRFDVHRDWDASAENIVDPWTDLGAIAAALPARVTHLGFGGWPAPAASAYVRMPSLTALSAAFPATRRLELTGEDGEEPGTLAMPELVDLEVRFADASDGSLTALAESKLDKLERLSVWLGGHSNCILDDLYPADEGYPDSIDGDDLERLDAYSVSSYVSPTAIGNLLDALPPTIKHLGIQSAMLDVDMCEAILARPLVARLETLDLSGGTLDDAAAKTLLGAAAKKALAKVKTLNVERNRLAAATAKKLLAAFPNARVGGQRKAETPELFIRFVAVME